MSAKDAYHDVCVRALEKDGWTITHDPLTLSYLKTEVFVDIGAERVVAAERGNEKIAVEIKSFLKPSPIQDLKETLGQCILYEALLTKSPENVGRTLYLAIREETYDAFFEDDIALELLRRNGVGVVTFNSIMEAIVQWIR